MEVLAAMFLSWIAANTPYNTSDVPISDVVELSAEAITAEYYQDYPHKIPKNGIDSRIIALYSWEEGKHGTIFILDRSLAPLSLSHETGLDNPLFQESLLHELLHHVQYHVGAYEGYACNREGREVPITMVACFCVNKMSPIHCLIEKYCHICTVVADFIPHCLPRKSALDCSGG